MAYIGLLHAVFAPIIKEETGKPIEYGEGFVIGPAMRANVSPTRNDTTLRGDDVDQESDNSQTGGSITLGVTHLNAVAHTKMLAVKEVTGEHPYYVNTGTPAPYGGFGYIRKMLVNGKIKYEANWIYKTQFARDAADAETQQPTTNYQTPTFTGKLMGVYVDENGPDFSAYYEYETLEEAMEWVDGWANINAPAAASEPEGQPVSD